MFNSKQLDRIEKKLDDLLMVQEIRFVPTDKESQEYKQSVKWAEQLFGVEITPEFVRKPAKKGRPVGAKKGTKKCELCGKRYKSLGAHNRYNHKN